MSFSGSIRHLLVVGLLLAAGLVWPAAAGAFNGETGDQLVREVVIRGPDGVRLNSVEELNGLIGVQRCRNYQDKRLLFRFALDQTYRGTIEREDVYLMEFDAEEDFEGQCRRDEDKEGCTRIEHANPTGVSINRGQGVVDVGIDFEVLQTEEEGSKEECAFRSTSGGANGEGDAGVASDVSSMDATGGDVAGMDAGGMDAGDGMAADAGDAQGDAGAGAGTALNDHFYVVRVFLRGTPLRFGGEDREVVVDGPIRLDRTRPPSPKAVDARATENILKTSFEAPEDNEDEVDSYEVFFSTNPIDEGRTPEELDRSEGVRTRSLTNISATEGGRAVATVQGGIGVERDSSLYVGVAARERSGNLSEVSTRSEPITVQSSIDFWEKYRAAGGSETGGCGCRSASKPPTSSLVWAAVLAGFAGWRRRKDS